MFALLPGHLWLVLAAVVFELSFVLDCVDGQLARVRKVASPLGHLLDFLMDELKAMLIYGCIAVRLWQSTGEDLYLLVGLGGLFALASGLMLTSFMRRPDFHTVAVPHTITYRCRPISPSRTSSLPAETSISVPAATISRIPFFDTDENSGIDWKCCTTSDGTPRAMCSPPPRTPTAARSAGEPSLRAPPPRAP